LNSATFSQSTVGYGITKLNYGADLMQLYKKCNKSS